MGGYIAMKLVLLKSVINHLQKSKTKIFDQKKILKTCSKSARKIILEFWE